jgi:8-oxo-dGTP diphosphatase
VTSVTLPNPQIVVVGAAVLDRGRLLAARRRGPGALAGGWELPGGKVDPGESERAALVRELREELDVTVRPEQPVPRADGSPDWPLPGVGVLRVWTATLPPGERPVAGDDHDALRWLTHEEAFDVDWLPADVAVISELRHLGRSSGLWAPGGTAPAP